jgi:signal transduction histidine kinase/CheY-like chemotaxis protein
MSRAHPRAGWARWLQLDEDRVLLAQLRLLLNHVGTSVGSTIFLSTLLVWTLGTPDNLWGLGLWAVTVIASKLLNFYHARRTLQAGLTAAQAPQLVGTLMALNAADGVAWGLLPWMALDSASVAGAVLVIAVMAGVKSYAMSVLSAVFPVFVAFCVFDAAAIALKLWHMNDPAYHTLAVVALLYVGTLIAQSHASAKVTRSSIALVFENTDLMARLRQETNKAHAAHQEAVKANLAKSKFLAAASHDLRQPIHAQGLFLEVIGRGELSPLQREMLNNARATADASTELLNTLLDFSRIEAGVIGAQEHAFCMQPLLNKIETELAPQATAKGLVFRSRETHAGVQSDPALVALILRNLVSNAIRYTDTGGVLMGCRTYPQRVVFEIWDTGIGIDPSQHEAIFREFHQLGNPERDRNKGLGLGLAIVEGLVRLLGLQLSLASVPGRGSVFKLTLPRSHAALSTHELVHALTHEGALADVPPPPLKKWVLLIDDDAAIRTGMVKLLTDWGCWCLEAESTDEALRLARTQRPDLVISDYRLREQRTGAQAIAALRAACGPELPALVITGDTSPERLRETQASGLPILHKPVSPSLLHRTLVTALTTRPPGLGVEEGSHQPPRGCGGPSTDHMR